MNTEQTNTNIFTYITPLVVGSLGAIPKLFSNRLKQIGITAGTAQVQNTVSLGTARILRKVLKSKATGCGSISTVFSSIVLLCVSSIMITTTMIMIITIRQQKKNDKEKKWETCKWGGGGKLFQKLNR